MKLGPGIVLLWNASHRYHPFTLDSILTDSYGTRIIVYAVKTDKAHFWLQLTGIGPLLLFRLLWIMAGGKVYML